MKVPSGKQQQGATPAFISYCKALWLEEYNAVGSHIKQAFLNPVAFCSSRVTLRVIPLTSMFNAFTAATKVQFCTF